MAAWFPEHFLYLSLNHLNGMEMKCSVFMWLIRVQRGVCATQCERVRTEFCLVSCIVYLIAAALYLQVVYRLLHITYAHRLLPLAAHA